MNICEAWSQQRCGGKSKGAASGIVSQLCIFTKSSEWCTFMAVTTLNSPTSGGFYLAYGPRGEHTVWPVTKLYLQWPELLVPRWAYELLKTNEQQWTIFDIVRRRACILSLDYLNFQLLRNPLWSVTIKPVQPKSELWNLEKLSSDDIHPLKKAVPDFLNF